MAAQKAALRKALDEQEMEKRAAQKALKKAREAERIAALDTEAINRRLEANMAESVEAAASDADYQAAIGKALAVAGAFSAAKKAAEDREAAATKAMEDLEKMLGGLGL